MQHNKSAPGGRNLRSHTHLEMSAGLSHIKWEDRHSREPHLRCRFLFSFIQYWAGSCSISVQFQTLTAGHMPIITDAKIEFSTGKCAAWIQRTCACGASCSFNGRLPPKQPIRAEPLQDQ